MNTYIALTCLLAAAGVSHGSAIGLGWNGLGYGGLGLGGLGWDGVGLGGRVISAPIIAPAAVSTANLYKAAPIPVLRTWAAAPIISAPVIKTVVAPAAPLGLGWSGVNPWGYGLGSWGKGLGSLGGWGKI